MHSAIANSLRVAAAVSHIPIIPFLAPNEAWLTTRLVEVMLISTAKLSAHIETAVSSASKEFRDLRLVLYDVDVKNWCSPSLKPLNTPLYHGVCRRDEWVEYLCMQLTTVVALIEEGTVACRTGIEELTSVMDSTHRDLVAVENRVRQRTNTDGLPTFSILGLYDAVTLHLDHLGRMTERLPSTEMYLYTTFHSDDVLL